mmetsp:Transcript_22093/g.71295  ORF Transcript_22093/g.71295 Transcript_22093/m.71295 type:complete len:217 (-) Transcript_22093:280-930(-)
MNRALPTVASVARVPGTMRAPSKTIATGMHMARAMAVSTPYRFCEVRFTPTSPPCMTRLAVMARMAKATFDSSPDTSDTAEKDTSDAVAKHTPAMTGTKDRYTGSGKIWPKKSAEKRQVKRGSAVLTTLVKATVPYAGATVESRCPAARHPAMGVSLRTSSKDRTGGARACSGAARPGRGIGVQRSRRVSTPTSSWAAADVHGKFQFDSTSLLTME